MEYILLLGIGYHGNWAFWKFDFGIVLLRVYISVAGHTFGHYEAQCKYMRDIMTRLNVYQLSVTLYEYRSLNPSPLVAFIPVPSNDRVVVPKDIARVVILFQALQSF